MPDSSLASLTPLFHAIDQTIAGFNASVAEYPPEQRVDILEFWIAARLRQDHDLSDEQIDAVFGSIRSRPIDERISGLLGVGAWISAL